jgi:hypothetical protein
MTLRFYALLAGTVALASAPTSSAQDRPPTPPVEAPAPAPITEPTLDLSAAAPPDTTADAAPETSGKSQPTPDVEIDVERLRSDSLRVSADYLVLNLRLNADVADLLHIDAGLEVRVDSVTVETHGTEAAAQARLYLDVVTDLLSEALQVIDDHPELAGAAPTSGSNED